MNPTKLTIWGLLSLAIPSIVSQLLNNAFRIIDQYSIQWLGSSAQAAMGATSCVLIAAFSIFMLIGAGIGPLVGRATGEDDNARTIFIGQGLRATTIISFIYCAILILGSSISPILSDSKIKPQN